MVKKKFLPLSNKRIDLSSSEFERDPINNSVSLVENIKLEKNELEKINNIYCLFPIPTKKNLIELCKGDSELLDIVKFNKILTDKYKGIERFILRLKKDYKNVKEIDDNLDSGIKYLQKIYNLCDDWTYSDIDFTKFDRQLKSDTGMNALEISNMYNKGEDKNGLYQKLVDKYPDRKNNLKLKDVTLKESKSYLYF